MRAVLTAIIVSLAVPAFAQSPDLGAIVQTHVVPRYQALASQTAVLRQTSDAYCTRQNPQLIAAYHSAFDAWIGVSHLRFGPSEVDDRAFALAFWPDPRGKTPKILRELMGGEPLEGVTAADFAEYTIAARGFYALDYLLFDPEFEDAEFARMCQLVKLIVGDMYSATQGILTDWELGYAALMTDAGNDTYRTEREAAQQVFTALTTGLEFTANMRLGRPLGTFDRPRPNRAEAHRSGRPLRNVVLSLEATRELAALISGGNETVDADFARALERAAALDDPMFAGVADPGARFRIEALQSSVLTIYRTLLEDVGPALGITAGFNSLDGD